MIGPINEQKAGEMDKTKEPYTVVIGNPGSPLAFIEISTRTNSYAVNFLDDLGRDYLTYSFQESKPAELFLSQAVFREYGGDSDSIVKGSIYWFSPDGKVIVEKVEYPSNKAVRWEGRQDVSANWEVKPEFGKYENLLTRERLSGA